MNPLTWLKSKVTVPLLDGDKSRLDVLDAPKTLPIRTPGASLIYGPQYALLSQQAENVLYAMSGSPFNADTDDVYVTANGGIVHTHYFPTGGAA